MTAALVCSPWLDLDDFSLCKATDFDPPEVFGLVVDAATDMLFVASGRQYPGVCVDTVRPPSANLPGSGSWFGGSRASDGSLWLGHDGIGTLPESTFGGWGGGSDAVMSQGFEFSSVRLPGFPIQDVSDITIDGVALAAGSWLIVDDRWIVRRDGKAWPLWQRLDRPAGEANTWSVTYSYGPPTPPAGLLALQVLVCELGLGWKGDKSCRLPKRLTQITREGLSAVVLDPFKFLDKGQFGVYEIDTFINMANPHHLSRDGKVINVDLIGGTPHHVR